MSFEIKAYEEYQKRWIKDHISETEYTATFAAYENTEEAKDMSFKEYVEEYGFANGELYASYDEFCDNELQDEDYMKEILSDNPELWKEYLRYMEEK